MVGGYDTSICKYPNRTGVQSEAKNILGHLAEKHVALVFSQPRAFDDISQLSGTAE